METTRAAVVVTVFEDRYRKAEGCSPLFEVFTPTEERQFITKLVAIAAFVVGVGIAIFAALPR
jgi:hypothetical protein